MKYVVMSTAVVDEIRFADGNCIPNVSGGAGFYAMSGIKLWDDDVILATGIGADYSGIYKNWYEKNNINMSGLIIKDANTPRTIVQYFFDGEREETPRYGEEHYKKMALSEEESAKYFREAKGIYIFKNSDEEFWKNILELKKESDATVMWEIACDATYPENLENVKNIAQNIDILSINMTEAKNLLNKENEAEIINALREWNLKLIFLRKGAWGATMITPQEIKNVPAEKEIKVVDTTGGGNSSSGAVLCGFCEGKDIETCARMGNLSAAMCLAQYGVPKHIDYDMRQAAIKKLNEQL